MGNIEQYSLVSGRDECSSVMCVYLECWPVAAVLYLTQHWPLQRQVWFPLTGTMFIYFANNVELHWIDVQ